MSGARVILPLLAWAMLGTWPIAGDFPVSLGVGPAHAQGLVAGDDGDEAGAGPDEEIGAEGALPPELAPDAPVVEAPETPVAPPVPEIARPPVAPPIPPGARTPFERAPAGSGTAQITLQEDLVNLDFADAEIQDVVKQISEITGKNFILDERVRGKITIISPTRVTIDEAYRVFESVLQVKGFTTITVGDFIKIIPLREAKESYTPILPGGTPVPRNDEYITRLIPLQYVDATEISNSLKPLVSRDASKIPYAPTNTIILSDTAYNIDKVLDIIRLVAVSSYQEVIEIIQLRFAAAGELAGELREVFTGQAGGAAAPAARGRVRPGAQAGAGAGQEPKIIVDERTNSLIILASPREIEDIRHLIRRLDYETERGRIHVYYLENADAEEMAETLGRLGVGEGGEQRGGGGARGGPPEGVPAAVVATVAQLGENVKIAHDAPTNALIIEAPPEAYDTLRQVIAKLDIKRPQVLVEALILEVSVGPNTLSTGVTVAGGSFFDNNDPTKGGIFGSTRGATGGSLIGSDTLSTIIDSGGAASMGGAGGFDPIFGSLVSGFHAVNVRFPGPDGVRGTADDEFKPIPVIRAAIDAAASRADTNILSAPSILTTDNEEAEIQVGENIPIQTAAVSSTASATGVLTDNTLVNNSFERQDTGVILRVTPQISEGNSVRLDIENEITEVQEGSPVGLPTLTKRSVKNTVYVADSATVVIGGIISSRLGKSSDRVPWLGDIPGLGWAFKNKSKTMRKVNLIVFLTPHIVRTPDDLRQVTNYKQEEFEGKSREALRKTDKEEREEREKEAKAAAEGKTLDEYEEEYDLRRRRSPVEDALKDVKQKNLKKGDEPDGAAPKASPGRKEEIIGGAPEAKAPAEDDVTGGVLNGGESEGEAAAEPPAKLAPEKLAKIAPEPETSAVPEPGGFTVQVGAFSDRDQAEQLVDRLRDQKYDVYLSSAVTDEGAVAHRVRVGRFDKDSEASRVASKLAKEFHDDGAVPFVVELAE